MKSLPLAQSALSGICLLGLTHGSIRAQDDQSASAAAPVQLSVSSKNQAAASKFSAYKIHLLEVMKPKAAPLSASNPGAVSSEVTRIPETATALSGVTAENSQTAPASTAPVIARVPAPGFYPGDLSYFGGKVVKAAKSHPVYVDCAASCWGNPTTFLNHLGKSSLIHITDQYVGSTANNRYTVGTVAKINFSIFGTLTDIDMLSFVHTAAASLGQGYGNIYHIFLPAGVDVCKAGTSECYSPDNPSTFTFCAYHGSVTFSDIGHVLFTIEPYQNVGGCSYSEPTPNGALIDSTASTLSHELIESITDPDLDAWSAVQSGGTLGQEIGDVCVRLKVDAAGFLELFDPPTCLNGKDYAIQAEYSNKYHACSYAP
jgi:hypothetical protein